MAEDQELERREKLVKQLSLWPSLAAEDWASGSVFRTHASKSIFFRRKDTGRLHVGKFKIDRDKKIVKSYAAFAGKRKATTVAYIEQGNLKNPQRSFVGPLSLEPVARLYFVREHVGDIDYYDHNAAAYRTLRRLRIIDRLRGQDLEGGPPRGEKRAACLRELQMFADDDLTAYKILISEARKLRGKQKAQPDPRDPLDTLAGLQDGLRDNIEFEPLTAVEWEALRAVADSEARPSASRLDHPIGILEDHIRLDLRVIEALGGLPQGLSLLAFGWATNDGPVLLACRIMIFPEGVGVALLDWTENGVAYAQRLKIVTVGKGTPSERLCAICPVANVPLSVLALRAGRFAHPVAQRLVHRSQRKAPAG